MTNFNPYLHLLEIMVLSAFTKVDKYHHRKHVPETSVLNDWINYLLIGAGVPAINSITNPICIVWFSLDMG